MDGLDAAGGIDTSGFDMSSLLPSNVSFGGGNVSADIGGTTISYATSAPSGATVGRSAPIYSSPNSWIQRQQNAFGFHIPNWMLLAGVVVVGLLFLRKRKFRVA